MSQSDNSGRFKRAAVLTLGCKVNQFESDSLAAALEAAGYELAAPEGPLDLVVLNTCTVTHRADQEARRLIRSLKKKHPGARLVVTGCLAQRQPEALKTLPEADLILGQAEKGRLVEILASNGPRIRVKSWAEQSDLSATLDYRPAPPRRTRAFFKIQDGCQAGCAYCAVPEARGPSRSLPTARVISGLKAYRARGLKEVVLCGVHLGWWGLDLRPALDLARLLSALNRGWPEPRAGGFRVRLSSLEPLEVSEEILALIAECGWLAPHLHLPVQSGDDEVLKAMGRPYGRRELDLLGNRLKNLGPYWGLGADFLVGFPGESEAAFEATCELAQALPLSYGHVFPYSRRAGTRACDWPGQIPPEEKKNRVIRLRRIIAAKQDEFARQNIGREVEALVENRPAGALQASRLITDNYLFVTGPAGLEGGQLIKVRLDGANRRGQLQARPLTPPEA